MLENKLNLSKNNLILKLKNLKFIFKLIIITKLLLIITLLTLLLIIISWVIMTQLIIKTKIKKINFLNTYLS
jgi:hypothetical protein